jgi:NDP-sugar pyrophosphorylase family protein
MKAVLLVGGEGTRLRPLTCNTVKAMVPILNRPFFAHLLAYLASHGVDDIVVTLCYLPDRIESRFADGRASGVRLAYVMEETPLGTAGAVKNAEPYLDGAFFVFNGDIITNIDLRAMLAFHRQRRAVATIAMHQREVKIDLGVIKVDQENRVVQYIEKPAFDYLVSMGVYVFEPAVLRYIERGARLDFPELVWKLLAADQLVAGCPHSGYWLDIGRPDDYARAVEEFEAMRDQFLPDEPPPRKARGTGRSTARPRASREKP